MPKWGAPLELLVRRDCSSLLPPPFPYGRLIPIYCPASRGYIVTSPTTSAGVLVHITHHVGVLVVFVGSICESRYDASQIMHRTALHCRTSRYPHAISSQGEGKVTSDALTRTERKLRIMCSSPAQIRRQPTVAFPSWSSLALSRFLSGLGGTAAQRRSRLHARHKRECSIGPLFLDPYGSPSCLRHLFHLTDPSSLAHSRLAGEASHSAPCAVQSHHPNLISGSPCSSTSRFIWRLPRISTIKLSDVHFLTFWNQHARIFDSRPCLCPAGLSRGL